MAPKAERRAARGALELRASWRRSVVGDLDADGVTPEALETIEVPLLRREDVHDEREEIHQDPLRAIVAFDVRRAHASLPQRVFDVVCDRPDLPAATALVTSLGSFFRLRAGFVVVAIFFVMQVNCRAAHPPRGARKADVVRCRFRLIQVRAR